MPVIGFARVAPSRIRLMIGFITSLVGAISEVSNYRSDGCLVNHRYFLKKMSIVDFFNQYLVKGCWLGEVLNSSSLYGVKLDFCVQRRFLNYAAA
jgi:hypothetical protein